MVSKGTVRFESLHSILTGEREGDERSLTGEQVILRKINGPLGEVRGDMIVL